MRHHTRAAILLGGWLLVEPPLDFGAKPVPPLTQWTVVRAFDTAEHCEAFKSGGLEESCPPPPSPMRPPHRERPSLPGRRPCRASCSSLPLQVCGLLAARRQLVQVRRVDADRAPVRLGTPLVEPVAGP